MLAATCACSEVAAVDVSETTSTAPVPAVYGNANPLCTHANVADTP
jgi:hypothetical protein